MWMNVLRLTFLPKRIIWVNAINVYHPQGHLRFDGYVPLNDIVKFAEGGEMYAMEGLPLSRPGCTHKRSGNVQWLHPIGEKPPSVDWYGFVPKREFEKWRVDIAERDKAVEAGDFSNLAPHLGRWS